MRNNDFLIFIIVILAIIFFAILYIISGILNQTVGGDTP
jgi:hypothetical protein